jgi:carbonic anhydrase
MSFGHFKEEMLHRGIPASALERADIDLDAWLEGFHDTEKSVRNTVAAILNHPLIPSDLTVRGFIIDSATGELTEVE